MAWGQTQVGVTGSVGTSNVEVNGLGVLDVVDPYIQSIPLYAFGLEYSRMIAPHLGVVTGIQYASRGFGVREQMNVNVLGLDLPIGARVETRVNYVEIPLALKYEFTDIGAIPFVTAGIAAGYALDGKIKPRVDAIIPIRLPDIELNMNNDLYNRWDISAIASAGVSIPVGPYTVVQVAGQYRHSLNDMFLDDFTDIRIKTHGISGSVSAAYRF